MLCDSMGDNLSIEKDRGTRIICAQLYKGGLSEASLILSKLRRAPFKGRSPEIGMEINLLTRHAERAYSYHLNHAIIIASCSALGLIFYAINSTISAIILAATTALILWKSKYMDRNIAINNFSKKEYNPNYGLENNPAAPIAKGEEAQNIIIFGDYFPFVGAGNRARSWNLIVDTTKPSKSNVSDSTNPSDILIDELYSAVDEELKTKGLPNLTQDYLLFADGRELESTFLKPFSVDTEPIYHLDPKLVFNEGHKGLYEEFRTYKSINYFDKSRSTLLSTFLRFSKIGRELFIECCFYILPPIDENRFNIDRIPLYDNSLQLKAAAITAIFSLAVLILGRIPGVSLITLVLVIVAAFMPLARVIRNKYDDMIIFKDLKERIKKGEPHNYGNIKTFRESISSKNYKNYFSAQDVVAIQNSIEKAIIYSTAKILDAKGIESSLLTGDLLTLVNKGIMMYGGKLEAEQISVGSGAKAIQYFHEHMQKIVNPPME